jgi:hypothetical protein
MGLSTTAEIMGLAKQLEEKSADFYRDLTKLYPDKEAAWPGLAEENKKYLTQIERTYYGVITDALEGCFSFDLDPTKFLLDLHIHEGITYSEVVHQALENERIIASFYSKAAQQSESLMADIPRAFKLVAKKRDERISRLKTLITEAENPA